MSDATLIAVCAFGAAFLLILLGAALVVFDAHRREEQQR
jgi:hypothetical protein